MNNIYLIFDLNWKKLINILIKKINYFHIKYKLNFNQKKS